MDFKTKEDVIKFIRNNFNVNQMLEALRILNSKKPVAINTPPVPNFIQTKTPKSKTPDIYKTNMQNMIEASCGKDVGIFNAFCKNKDLMAQLISLLHVNNIRDVPLAAPRLKRKRAKGKGKAVFTTPDSFSPVLDPTKAGPSSQKKLCLKEMKDFTEKMRKRLKPMNDMSNIKHSKGLGSDVRKHEIVRQGCLDEKCSLPIALKIFRIDDVHEIEILKMLQKEPVVVNYYKTFKIENHNILVSELVKGETLFDTLRFNQLSEAELISIFKQVLKSIQVLQTKYKLTHYDLHSNNILIQPVCKKTTLYGIPTLGNMVRFWDFDFAYTEKRSRLKAQSLTDYGIKNKFDPYFDHFLFINEMKAVIAHVDKKKYSRILAFLNSPKNNLQNATTRDNRLTNSSIAGNASFSIQKIIANLNKSL